MMDFKFLKKEHLDLIDENSTIGVLVEIAYQLDRIATNLRK